MVASSNKSPQDVPRYKLCECCNGLLQRYDDFAYSEDELKVKKKTRYHWRNVWSSFYCNLLTGQDEVTEKKFYEVYSPEYLWRFIPKTIRKFWIDERGMCTLGDGIYAHCTLDEPEPFFVDRTEEVNAFRKSIAEYTMYDFLKALDPDRLPLCQPCNEEGTNDVQRQTPMMIANVLCPYGCTEFATQAKGINPSAFIQAQLRKVQLNLPSGYFDKLQHCADTSRIDYIREDLEPKSYVLMNEAWPIMPTVVLSKEGGLRICVCRYHDKPSVQKRLLLHLPKKPHHCLSSTHSDQLSSAVIKPRVFTSIKRGKHNTISPMSTMSSSFGGVDSANVSTEGSFNFVSKMLHESEKLSVSQRPDIHKLAHLKVKEGKMTEEYLSQLMSEAEKDYGNSPSTEETLSLLKRGATFCPTKNALLLQKHSSDNHNSKVNAVLLQRDHSGGELKLATVPIDRSWTACIYNMQLEDQTHYGTPIKAIKPYRMTKNCPMMLWSLVGIVSACDELHYAIDQKYVHSYDNWTGHILAHIDTHYMKHSDNRVPRKTPFVGGKTTQSQLVELLEKCLPSSIRDADEDTDENHYRFNIEYFQNLFPPDHFPQISFHETLEEVMSKKDILSKDIIFVVGSKQPGGNGSFTIDNTKYECRVLLSLDIPGRKNEDDPRQSPGKFTGERYARFGESYCNWWKQVRHSKAKQLMTQYVNNNIDETDADVLPFVSGCCFKYVTVYVKVKQNETEKYRMDMYKSMGIQQSVLCKCTQTNPLLLCGEMKERKRECMIDKCNNLETFRCGTFGCNTRLCKSCFTTIEKKKKLPFILSPGVCTIADTGENDVENGNDDNTANDNDTLSECIESDEYVSSSSDRSTRSLESVKNEDNRSSSDCFEGVDEMDGHNGANDDDESGSYCSETEEDVEQDDYIAESFNIDEEMYANEDEPREESYHNGEEYDEYEETDQQNEDAMEGHGNIDDEFNDHSMNYPNPKRGGESGSECDNCELSSNLPSIRERMASTVNNIKGSNSPVNDMKGVDDMMEGMVACAMDNPYDRPSSELELSQVPFTNSAEIGCKVVERNKWFENKALTVPIHVLFNQAAACCRRFNKPIQGSQVQQSFVQRVVSSIRGIAFPLLFFAGCLFPCHYYSCASNDKSSILGSMPISCFRSKVHPDGFASQLEVARNHATHASSSTANCHIYTAFTYDILANQSSNGIDSRLVARQGFRVSTSTKSGLELRKGDDSQLHESLDSRQGAMNLAAASQEVPFDLFVTFTCGQSRHPGIRHLHEWKNSMNWTSMIPGYRHFTNGEKEEMLKSFEMAYLSQLNRVWLEVRKYVLEFITYGTASYLEREIEVFFRDEYQEMSGNLAHIHGLMAFTKKDMEKEVFKKYLCDLQKNSIVDLLPPEEFNTYIRKGLVKDKYDWKTCTAAADEVLQHFCHDRCKMRINDTGTDADFKCRKHHPEFDSECPLKDDFIPFDYQWDHATLSILQDIGLYEPPSRGFPKGKFLDKVLNPKRHMGRVTPGAGGNMSPVIPEWFVLTRSMQNAQVVTDTNGVSRYVVKYIIKMDQGNRCIIWADSHTGAVMRAQSQFLHNTKITRSAKNEQSAFEKSRSRNKPVGRCIAFNEYQQQILGINDCFTTFKFVEICTRPLEHRSTTRIKLDKEGNLIHPKAADVTSCVSDVSNVRRVKFAANHPSRLMTKSQDLILKVDPGSGVSFDKVTLFSIRPVELFELFQRIGEYYKWFFIEDKVLSTEQIEMGLDVDVKKCWWIDGLGRRVFIRKRAIPFVREKLEKVTRESVGDFSWQLREHLLQHLPIENGSRQSSITNSDGMQLDAGDGDGGEETESIFYQHDDDSSLPIPVFSNVTPSNSTHFLMHVMLMLGDIKTEVDLTENASSIRDCLVMTKLIPGERLDDHEALSKYSNELLKRIITEVFPFQPISMKRLEEYIIKCKRLLDSAICSDSIPIDEYPPCLVTELLNSKDKKLSSAWTEVSRSQLASMLSQMPKSPNMPIEDEFLSATKSNRLDFDLSTVIVKSDEQSDASYKEQQCSIDLAVSAINQYSKEWGPKTQVKGILTHGSPGSGKSFVLQAQGLYAFSQGLRVMSTSLMAFRSHAIGGIHIHVLFALEVNRNANIFRQAEIALDKLHRKSNLKLLHFLLTMDVLLLDECGQLSAQQFALLDIILRHARHNNLPFGGVLILGTFDHAQLGAIKGLPFLLSSHILTDFTLIRMKHSVRAHSDAALQEIQDITRKSPNDLLGNTELEKRFKSLVDQHITFVPSWDSNLIPPDADRMYSKRKNAVKSAEENLKSKKKYLEKEKIPYILCRAKDYMRVTSSNSLLVNASKDPKIVSYLDRKVKEPKELLFYAGAFFEITANDTKRGKYQSSQIVRMLKVPTEEDVQSHQDVEVMKPKNNKVNYQADFEQSLPTEEDLIAAGWEKIKIGIPDERFVSVDSRQACRKQYTIRHMGSSTINKQMGNTLTGTVAIEMTTECCPWEKGQIVVMLSRSPKSSLIVIVGHKEFAINRMWEVICKRTQWTDLIESILDNLSIEGDDVLATTGNASERGVVNMAEHFPYRISDYEMPTSNSGYVYLLISTVAPDRMYVGQCNELGKRLNDHNKSVGSLGTAPTIYKPYAIAAFLTNMSHMDEKQRMSIESQWRNLNSRSALSIQAAGLASMIDNGRTIMNKYNDNVPQDCQIRLVECFRLC